MFLCLTYRSRIWKEVLQLLGNKKEFGTWRLSQTSFCGHILRTHLMYRNMDSDHYEIIMVSKWSERPNLPFPYWLYSRKFLRTFVGFPLNISPLWVIKKVFPQKLVWDKPQDKNSNNRRISRLLNGLTRTATLTEDIVFNNKIKLKNGTS